MYTPEMSRRSRAVELWATMKYLDLYMRNTMKTIGLLGGMSWESTVIYYRLINEGIKHTLGGLHSAKIILYSVDLDPIEKLIDEPDLRRKPLL